MDTPTSSARFTSLLDNSVLARLERMRLAPLRRMTNRSRGEHQSGKGGTSTEFADYRDYVPGDDVKNVDWNIFARLERPFVKLYRHEEELHVVALVDASASMQFEGKFERAKQLAAAFCLMGLMNIERVSAYSCNHPGSQPNFLPPCTGRISRKRLFEFLEGIPPGGDYPIDAAIDSMLSRHRGRGIVVILSDFLTFGDLQKPLNMLYSAGLEIFAVQILGPTEINPEITGDVRFVDSESGYSLDVSNAGDLLGVYQDHRLALEEELATMCRQRSGRFLSISSADSIESVLFDQLRRKGWVR
ncbi:MAG: DUF58 domain-containing protein [Planctomycetaceae bacterium]|nr:MAG: DUF58 domain-containing protein [Planctomycetaceae bacterium]